MVSCRFSLKPIHWHRVLGTFTGTKPYQHILMRKLLVWMDNLNISWWLKNNMVVVICCLNQSKSQKFIWFTNPEATNPDSSDLILLGLNRPWTSPFCCFRCDIPTKNVRKKQFSPVNMLNQHEVYEPSSCSWLKSSSFRHHGFLLLTSSLSTYQRPSG